MHSDLVDHPQKLNDPRLEHAVEQATSLRRGVAVLAARLRQEGAGDLTVNQSAVLGMLFRFGDLTPGEIATRLGRSPQALTRTFQALEGAGLLERRPDPADGRQILLALTLDGREALGSEMRPRDRWLGAALLERCTESEREILVVAARLLEALADAPVTSTRTRRVDDE